MKHLQLLWIMNLSDVTDIGLNCYSQNSQTMQTELAFLPLGFPSCSVIQCFQGQSDKAHILFQKTQFSLGWAYFRFQSGHRHR